jgi:3-oxoacyl-[acyl-carrier-protein] synthase-1
MGKEVCITGAGVVSALGIGKERTLDALRNQRSGLDRVRFLETMHTGFPVGEVKYSNDELREQLSIPPSEAYIRSSLLAIPAVGEALRQAGLAGERSSRNIAFLSGLTVGGMDQTENMYADFLTNQTKNDYIELNDCGACTEQIADYFGGFRMVSTIVTACSSSANTLMMAADLIRTGRADMVVAGGTECLSRYHVNGFHTLMILDQHACRPFDRDRAGINLGEGAGYLVLESMESARKRGVSPVGKLSGYYNACDAFHATASSPDGLGPYLAMKGAVENAGLKPEDIDYLNAHGTGTPNNDLTEGLAVMRLFGEKTPPLSSIKAYTGHTTSAAGGFEAVVSLLAIEHNFLPVNKNFRHRIEEHSFTPVTHPDPVRPIRHVLSNSFGFGGNDSAIILSKM